jgi:hypothetical protein
MESRFDQDSIKIYEHEHKIELTSIPEQSEIKRDLGQNPQHYI